MLVARHASSGTTRAAELAHQRIGKVVHKHRKSRYQLAKELLAFEAKGHAAVLGYASVQHYAREMHQLSGRLVRNLLHLARSLTTLPELDKALAKGILPWTKARTMLPIVDKGNEQAWIDTARHDSVRTLEARVAAVAPGDPPPARADIKEPATVRMFFSLPAVEAEKVRDLIACERAKAPEAEQTDGEILAALLRRVAHDASNAPGGGKQPVSTERYRVVLQRCPDCGRTEGQRADVEDAIAEEACCDAEVVDLTPGPQQGRLSRTIPPRVRRAVLLAYGSTCAVPGCACRLWVDLHHVRPIAGGGDHRPTNLIPLCPAHHRLLHRGCMGLERIGHEWVFRFHWAPERRLPVAHVGHRAVPSAPESPAPEPSAFQRTGPAGTATAVGPRNRPPPEPPGDGGGP